MKNIIFTLLVAFTFVTCTSAATTKNGVPITPSSDITDKKVEVNCKYTSNYIVSFLKLDKNDTEGLYEQGNGIADGIVPNMGEYLLEKGFMTSDGFYDCPKYAIYYVNDNNDIEVIDFANDLKNVQRFFLLKPEESSCVGACQGEQFIENEKWTCDYTSQIRSGTTIQTKYDGINYMLINRDHEIQYVSGTTIRSDCGDIFLNLDYNGGNNFLSMEEDIRRISDLETLKNLHNFLCKGNERKPGIEYYCSGNCRYSNNKQDFCSYLNDKISYQTGTDETELSLEICQNTEVKKSLRFIGRILIVVKIIIPLLLIIYGFIDFGKAIVSSNAETSSKALKRLTTRVLTGVIIFILPTLINFVFGLFPKKYHFIDCSECIFKPSSCRIED